MSAPNATPRPNDVFPATQLSWIADRLGQGERGRGEVNTHIMNVYRWPLHVYFLGTRDRWLGEPDEVINGFFADRLPRANFLADWRASGLRLRHWLINAFCFYLRELRRARARHAPPPEGAARGDEPVVFSGDSRAVDHAYVASLVRRALDLAEQHCRSAGLDAHWSVFTLHFCHERSYDQFVADLGIDAARAVVMARTAKNKFQNALRELIARDSITGDIDQEIRSLLEGA
jgi:hypothetical protein